MLLYVRFAQAAEWWMWMWMGEELETVRGPIVGTGEWSARYPRADTETHALDHSLALLRRAATSKARNLMT